MIGVWDFKKFTEKSTILVYVLSVIKSTKLTIPVPYSLLHKFIIIIVLGKKDSQFTTYINVFTCWTQVICVKSPKIYYMSIRNKSCVHGSTIWMVPPALDRQDTRTIYVWSSCYTNMTCDGLSRFLRLDFLVFHQVFLLYFI